VFISALLQWLEDSSLASAIRQSTWLYPAFEIVHITGIVLLVGSAFMFDLRLLSSRNKISVHLLARFLLSWSRRGLWLIIPSGIFLFITNATTLAYDRVFWLKMLLLLVAGLNAITFHRYTLRIISTSDESASLTITAKFNAVISIIAWIGVITCGRLLAY
jgi:hypothetical protein